MTEEIWKPVVGFEGLYEVSNLGRVRSLDRVITAYTGRVQRLKGRVLKVALDGWGYPFVTLSRGGITGPKKVHNLVAEHFIGPRPAAAEVRHGDNDRTNARLDNLCYGTHQDNMDDAKRHGTTRKGELNPHAKLTVPDVLRIRASRLPSTSEAECWDVSPSLIRQIRRRAIWQHV